MFDCTYLDQYQIMVHLVKYSALLVVKCQKKKVGTIAQLGMASKQLVEAVAVFPEHEQWHLESPKQQ